MSDAKSEQRQAARINVNIPTLVEVIGMRTVKLQPNLEKVYQRVNAADERVGEKFPAVLRDLSTNGAFISGPALPLLSRVAFTFPLDGHGQVEFIGWSLWRRTESCEIPRDGDASLKLAAGFGVLFEAISLEARQAIAKVVNDRTAK
jgi:hypothetical protein